MSPPIRESGGVMLMERSSRVACFVLLALLLTAAAADSVAADDRLRPAVHLLTASDRMFQLAAQGGYESAVQLLPWRDVEPTDGEWHWQQPDFAVRAAEYYDLGLIVRLDHPPDWAVRSPENGEGGPIDPDAYADFVATVARRYRGQVQAYIVWNEPNLSLEWADRPPDPAGYTALLCRAYSAIKAADPGATVVSAGLAPTNGGEGAMDERQFLHGMLEAGAAACFDVLGAHAYGFGRPPDDPRDAPDGLNLARLLDLRSVLEMHGADATAVWITELGWTTEAAGPDAWQQVSREQQADYLCRSWDYIKDAWPSVQLATVWNLSEGLSKADGMAGYSLLDAGGEPRPAYQELRTLFAGDVRGTWFDWASRMQTAWRKLTSTDIPILAADEVVHLGDNQ